MAAVVIAPFVQGSVATILTSFLVLPAMLLLGAHLWQLLPNDLALRLAGWPRLMLMVAVFPLSILVSSALSGTVERVLFRFDSVRDYSHGLDELFASLRPAYLARRERYFAAEAGVFGSVIRAGHAAGEFDAFCALIEGARRAQA